MKIVFLALALLLSSCTAAQRAAMDAPRCSADPCCQCVHDWGYSSDACNYAIATTPVPEPVEPAPLVSRV